MLRCRRVLTQMPVVGGNKQQQLAALVSVRGMSTPSNVFKPTDQFLHRHVGSFGKDKQDMLDKVGFATLPDLLNSTVPKAILLGENLKVRSALCLNYYLNSILKILKCAFCISYCVIILYCSCWC